MNTTFNTNFPKSNNNIHAVIYADISLFSYVAEMVVVWTATEMLMVVVILQASAGDSAHTNVGRSAQP